MSRLPVAKCLLKFDFQSFCFDSTAQKYYHARLMSAQTVIDSLEFAHAGQELRGSLPVARLARVKDDLLDPVGEVRFILRGGRDEERRPILQVEISGSLHLQCQRCLGMLEYPLRVCNTLLLMHPGAAVGASADDPEAPDCIEAGAQLDVIALIEDEILLSLPFAPRHAEGSCQSAFAKDRGERDAEERSAFAGLAGLKSPRQRP